MGFILRLAAMYILRALADVCYCVSVRYQFVLLSDVRSLEENLRMTCLKTGLWRFRGLTSILSSINIISLFFSMDSSIWRRASLLKS